MLTPGQVADYRRDGFLVVKGAVTGDELARLQEATDRLIEEGVARGRKLDEAGPVQLKTDSGFRDWEPDEEGFLYGRTPDGSRIFRRAQSLWPRHAAFRAATVHPVILNVVWQLVGEDVVPTHEALVVKMPSAGAAIPWHRDPTAAQWFENGGDCTPDFTCDLYLDPSTQENGCLWALPGSHRAGADGQIVEVEEHEDISAVEGAVPLEAEPGDLLLHSVGVLHASPKNESASCRRTFYVHYRPPADLLGGWWSQPVEWVEDRVRWMREFAEERPTLGLADPEPYLRPVEPALTPGA